MATDEQGRMRAAALERAGAGGGADDRVRPGGDINTGAFDPISEIVATCRSHGAWCHIDGAFGLWVAASPVRRGLLDGYVGADSWATDGRQVVNVPYDCGIAVVDGERTARGDGVHGGLHPRPRRQHPWGSTGRRSSPAGHAAYRVRRPAFPPHRGGEIVDRCCDHATLSPIGCEEWMGSRSSTTSCSTRSNSASTTATR